MKFQYFGYIRGQEVIYAKPDGATGCGKRLVEHKILYNQCRRNGLNEVFLLFPTEKRERKKETKRWILYTSMAFLLQLYQIPEIGKVILLHNINK